jgi:hypothetical protein
MVVWEWVPGALAPGAFPERSERRARAGQDGASVVEGDLRCRMWLKLSGPGSWRRG